MKKIYKISLCILIMSAFAACSVKSTSSKLSTTNATNPIGTVPGPGTPGPGTTYPTDPTGCDGIFHDGATQCYYKNIPTIQVMGVTTANAGKTIWSTSSLGGSISQNQFATDAVFNVRIVPRMAIKTNPAVNPSVAGKSCNHLMTADKIASKLWVQLKLQTNEEDIAGSTNGEIATLSASIDQPSPVWRFTSRPTASHLVLKVVTVLSDSRCNQGGTGYCPFADIPLSYPASATIPTECVAFDVQFSTDTTYDLPGPRAN